MNHAEQSIRRWFEILRERGEFVDFSVIEQPKNSAGFKENIFFHGEMDGLASFLSLLEKSKEVELFIPELPARPNPATSVYVISFLRYLARLPYSSIPWSIGPTDWKKKGIPERPLSRAWRALGRKDTSQIWHRAREHKVGRNNYFLYYLNQSIAPLQQQNSGRANYWLIPVHLRFDLKRPRTGNITGFVDARISRDTTLMDLDYDLKKRLARGEAYGGYAGLNLGRLGENVLQLLIRLNERMQIRAGVFTNLGNWKAAHEVDRTWFGLPPVIQEQPVGAMTGSLNEEQSLALHFHPWLTRDPQIAKETLERWIEGLLRGP